VIGDEFLDIRELIVVQSVAEIDHCFCQRCAFIPAKFEIMDICDTNQNHHTELDLAMIGTAETNKKSLAKIVLTLKEPIGKTKESFVRTE
jgi:hypothetical protein